ncbi:MAG: sensor histidine kinase, partial [Longimicrobiales bacterium]
MSVQTAAPLVSSEVDTLEEALRKKGSLLALIESINSELELRPLLTLILRHACNLIGADDGAIGLIDSARSVVRIEAIWNLPPSELGSEFRAGVGLAGEVLRRGEPVVLRRYGDLEGPTLYDRLENPVIGMPMQSREGRMIGFFGIGIGASNGAAVREALGRKRYFEPSDVEMLGIFARHAAIAVENARRYASERQRTERLGLIARIGHVVTADLRLSELLRRAANAIHELLDYPNVCIPLVEPGDTPVLVVNTVGGHYKDIVHGEYRIPITDGIMGAAVRERRTQLVNDVANDPRHIPTPGAVGIIAELAVPIVLGERVLGVLNVESSEPFGEEDATSLRIVADQLAVAIENARLHERGRTLAALEERQRLARDLHDSVTQHLFGMVMIAESLEDARRRDPTEAARRGDRLLELSRSALREMRYLLTQLRPNDATASGANPVPASIECLHRDGLPTALANHIANSVGDELEIALEVDAYVQQPHPVEEALFRIAQEAVNNVVKHAHARHAVIKLRSDHAATRLSVTDDGVGTCRKDATDPPVQTDACGPPAAVEMSNGGFGLTNMRERAESVGGEFR